MSNIKESICLANNPDFEVDIMDLESGDGLLKTP